MDQSPRSHLKIVHSIAWASQVALVVKNPPSNVGDVRDKGSIPGSGRSPGVGNGNPLQYSCLENFMDRGAWWATGVTKSQTPLNDWEHTHSYNSISHGMTLLCPTKSALSWTSVVVQWLGAHLPMQRKPCIGFLVKPWSKARIPHASGS